MKKFIQTISDRLKKEKTGMHDNSGDWTGQPVNEAAVDSQIALLKGKDDAITTAENALKQAHLNAHNVIPTAKVVAGQVENLALGIYSTNVGKLTEYGISLPASGSPKPAPAKGTIKSIKDDVDGEGFIIEREALPNTDTCEWQKAAGIDPAALVIDPAKFAYFKISKKMKFVDDDVVHGTRYFYRFRGHNANHNGEWSEAVSALQ